MCAKPDRAPRPASDLSVLLEAELRVEALLEQARAEAGAILAAARADADRARASIEVRRAEGERRIDADVAASSAARLDALERDAGAELAHYRALGGPRRRELARSLAAILAGIARGEPPP